MPFRMGELFCGPGGLACGALQAKVDGHPELRIEHAWANDFDEATCETYRHNICKNDKDASVYCGDVRKLDISYNNDNDQIHTAACPKREKKPKPRKGTET